MMPAPDHRPAGAVEAARLRRAILGRAGIYFAEAAAGNMPADAAKAKLLDYSRETARAWCLGDGVAEWAVAAEWHGLQRNPHVIKAAIRRTIAPLVRRRAPGAEVVRAARIAVARVRAVVPDAAILAYCRATAADVLRHG